MDKSKTIITLIAIILLAIAVLIPCCQEKQAKKNLQNIEEQIKHDVTPTETR